MNRRDFLKTSALVGAGLALPSFYSGCAHVARAPRRPKPSDRIQVGFVGYGTMATYALPSFLGLENVQVVAVADPVRDLPNYGYKADLRGGRDVGKQAVDEFYSAQATSGAYKGCRAYEDFRDMFDKESLDAIVVSTPDHWHCPILVEAARRGIHVYGQKPLSLTINEGKRMVEVVRESGITFQTGSQQRSTAYFRIAAEYIRNGRLGKVERIEIGLPGGHPNWSGLADRKQVEAVPAGVNYDLWLGPAPEKPYIPARFQVLWRHNLDYSGGMITDWGAHHIDITQWALGVDFAGGPLALENIVATTPAYDEVYNTTTDYDFDAVYAGGVRVNINNKRPNGIRFIGENGKEIFVNRNELVMTPSELRKQKITPDEIHLYESNHHEKNFIDSIYSGKPTVAPIEVGHRTITVSHLANIAIRLGRDSIKWDPVAETVPNDPKAQALMGRESRKAYTI